MRALLSELRDQWDQIGDSDRRNLLLVVLMALATGLVGLLFTYLEARVRRAVLA